MKNKITNTAEQADKDPTSVLTAAAILGPSGAIEAQEAQGQRELVAAGTLLPREFHDSAALEKFGVKFGQVVEGDDLFVHAELPPGWRLEASSHPMHSDLLDEKGRKRAGIFYKAAFYDRRATGSAKRRVTVNWNFDPPRAPTRKRVEVLMEGHAEPLKAWPWSAQHDPEQERQKDEPHDKWMARNVFYASDKEAKEWADKHYPERNDPAAYWDLP